MKRTLLIALAVLALAGCASPKTATIENGKVTNISSAEAVTLIKQDNRRKLVKDVQDNAKPLLEIEAHAGQPITINAKSIKVHAPIDPALLLAEQPDAVSENVQVLREVRGIARETVVPLGLAGAALADRKSARDAATAQAQAAADAAVELETLRSAERQSLSRNPIVLTIPEGGSAAVLDTD